MRKRVFEQPESAEAAPVQRKKETPFQWWRWLKIGLLVLLTIFMLRILSQLIQQLVYTHRLKLPFFVDLSRPADFSLNHTTNMYLTPEEGISLGVWHTVPESRWKEAQGKDLAWYQKSLGDGSPVFIYLHGNTNSRAAPHRVGVAKVLSAIGCHVLVPDYRGFGDSSGQPTEAGLNTDALYLYNWVKARSGSSLIVIWGHSLGTGVATNTAAKLIEQGVVVDGVILEGAFINLGNFKLEYSGYHPYHPFSWFYWRFFGLDYFFTKAQAENKLVFPTDENVKKMRSPLLLLYSEDDHLTPLHMAHKLYEIAQTAQNSERVKLVTFEGSLGYLHNGLYRDPRLPEILKQFVASL
ncbi:lysophosphatidylserine lipase ABHD12 [Thalassophryne amazonica]|uniref:lysophosphatidylserine lipase ABHD12 n=1 Tax=Thalassophryne amazonica TaxID=390379 RepID=UPI0014711CD3|nr:lysophosphatidylserine lipase ABHD12 [Thalassophryne amazonica]